MTSAQRQTGAPSLLRVLVRPKWIGVLVLALLIASAFAWLGKWQLESAFASLEHGQTVAEEAQQSAVGLGELAQPQQRIADASVGRQVTVQGAFDARDFDVVEQRLQGEELGYWVIGRVGVVDDGAGAAASGPDAPGLAIAVGWTPTLDEAQAAAAALRESTAESSIRLSGRLEYGQAPVVNREGDASSLTSMAPAYLLNRWAETPPSNYGVYVSLDAEGLANLADIAELPRDVEVITPQQLAEPQLNWLNIFYAVEWALFAGFAVFMWWRLARDEHERERLTLVEAPGRLEQQLRQDRLREMLADRQRSQPDRVN